VGAGEVQLEGVDAAGCRALRQLLPAGLVVGLHERGDEDLVGVLLLEEPEVRLPILEGPVADELDVLEPMTSLSAL
jgi:hypothetical protein